MMTVLGRTLSRKCPNCGKGKLFAGYIKPVETCSHCEEPLAEIRADDGPAWLTMLLVGHILAPVMVFLMKPDGPPPWVSGLVLAAIAIIMSIVFLPLTKGLFMGIIWKTDAGEQQLAPEPGDQQASSQ